MPLNHIAHPQLYFALGSMNRKFLPTFGYDKVGSSQFISPSIHTLFEEVD